MTHAMKPQVKATQTCQDFVSLTKKKKKGKNYHKVCVRCDSYPVMVNFINVICQWITEFDCLKTAKV